MDWLGFVGFAVVDFGLDQDKAWSLSPPEWWAFWSLKHGQRKKRSDSGLNGDDVAEMRRQLDEQVIKERASRVRRNP